MSSIKLFIAIKTTLTIFVAILMSNLFLPSYLTANTQKTESTSNLFTLRPFNLKKEKLKYEVSYLNLVGGTITLISIPYPTDPSSKNDKKAGEGKIKFYLYGSSSKAVTSIFNLKIYMDSTFQTKNFQLSKLLQASHSRRENGELFYRRQNFDTPKKYTYTERRNREELKSTKIGYSSPETSDQINLSILAIFYFPRILNLNIVEGYQASFFLKNFQRPIEFKFIKKEKIKTKFGMIDSIVVDVIANYSGLVATKKLRVFLSDDDDRIPLSYEIDMNIGNIKINLVEGYLPN